MIHWELPPCGRIGKKMNIVITDCNQSSLIDGSSLSATPAAAKYFLSYKYHCAALRIPTQYPKTIIALRLSIPSDGMPPGQAFSSPLKPLRAYGAARSREDQEDNLKNTLLKVPLDRFWTNLGLYPSSFPPSTYPRRTHAPLTGKSQDDLKAFFITFFDEMSKVVYGQLTGGGSNPYINSRLRSKLIRTLPCSTRNFL
jgi:hypothetical protein